MNKIRDGDLYQRFEIEGVIFEIYYGYSTDSERRHGWEPSPIYPDFTAIPQYTPSGYPFATVYQDGCEHYKPIIHKSEDHWCYNCEMFDKREKHIGICKCEFRKCHTQRKNEGNAGECIVRGNDI